MTDKDLKEAINNELDKAEVIWGKVKDQLILEKAMNYARLMSENVPSKIPGFPFLVEGQPKVQDFVAMVLDLRDSTKHLLNAISEKTATATGLERVLYETTAIYTAGAMIVDDKKGRITEFLGDGFLALFKKDAENKDAIYHAHDAAQKNLQVLQTIVNPILKERYGLPELKVGIGLAYSKAIVTVVGIGNNLHAKALGECVYRASKLSKGQNEIFIDNALNLIWPTSDSGTLKLIPFKIKDLDAYKISR